MHVYIYFVLIAISISEAIHMHVFVFEGYICLVTHGLTQDHLELEPPPPDFPSVAPKPDCRGVLLYCLHVVVGLCVMCVGQGGRVPQVRYGNQRQLVEFVFCPSCEFWKVTLRSPDLAACGFDMTR